MAANNTTFNWDPTADSAETAFRINYDGEDTLAGGDVNQYAFYLNQSSNGTDVDEAADALLAIDNTDANDPVENGIVFLATAAGGFTNGINFDAGDFTSEIILENGEFIRNQTDEVIEIDPTTLTLTGTTTITASSLTTITTGASDTTIGTGDVVFTATGGSAGNADVDVDGYLEVGGTLDANGQVDLGDGGDTITINGSDTNIAIVDASTVNIDGDTTPTADLVALGVGDTTVTTGADALYIEWSAGNGVDLVNSGINLLLQNNGDASGDIMRGVFIDLAAATVAASTNKAIEIENTDPWDIDIELQNDESIDNVTDGIVNVTATTLQLTGTTFTGNGATTYDAGGAAAIVIGSGDVTAITLTTDSTGDAEVVLPDGSISGTEILDDTITAADLNATLSLADGDLLDLDAINVSSATEGLFLPQNATACSAATAEGQICWDTAGEDLYIGNGTAAVQMNGAVSTSLQSAYNTATIGLIETDATNPILFTETTAEVHGTVDILQITSNTATGGTNAGDLLQLTMDAGDANALTGHGIHMIIDQDRTTGNAILIEDDQGSPETLLQLTDDGALTLGTIVGATTAVTITDTGYTNALSIGDNDITGTTFDLIGTTATINFEDFDVDADGNVALTSDGGTTMLTLTPSIAQTADIISVNASAGSGISTDNVDGMYINIEGADGTSTDVAGVHIDFDPIAGSSDDTFVGLLVDEITPTAGIERGVSIGDGWDSNLFFNDTTTVVQVIDTGSIAIQDSAGNAILSLQDVGGSTNHVLTGDSDTGLAISGATTDLTTGTDETLTIVPNGTGDTLFNIDADTNVQFTATAVPAVDMVAITNAGQGITTAGVEGLSITYVGGAAAVESSGAKIDLTPGTTAEGTWNGLKITMNATGPVAKVVENGIKLEGPTSITDGGIANAIDISNDDWTTAININEAKVAFNTPFGGLGKYENQVVRSEQLDNASWAIETSGVTVAANDTAAPDGTTTAEKLTDNATAGTRISQSATASNSETWTFSVWIKNSNATGTIELELHDNSLAGASDTKSITIASPDTDNWRRYSITHATAGSGVTSIVPAIDVNQAGGGTAIYVWGAQLEKQVSPGVYHRTIATALTYPGSQGLVVDTNLNNTTASGLVYGSRFINFVVSGTAGQHDGVFIRNQDDTSLTGSTHVVRGLHVQAWNGSNTNGTNIGVDAYGKTFGISGTTDALAGAQSTPAAVFAYLSNGTATSTGNAIRAYSDTATGATLVSIFQETAAFTGTGLMMDIGTTGGFASGNFLSLKNAGTQLAHIDAQGNLFVSLRQPSGNEGVCHVGNDAVNDDELTSCNTNPVADYAEYYPIESDVTYGDLVSLGTEDVTTNDGGLTIKQLIKTTLAYDSNVIGVVSNNYSDFSSTGLNIEEVDNPMPVALSGRVPVKFSNENGEVEPGDFLTASGTVAGAAMKAMGPGWVIGQALNDPQDGQVMVFVQGFYYDPGADSLLADNGGLNLNTTPADETENLLVVESNDSEVFTINARGQATFTGNIFIKDGSFAGSATTDEEGNKDITFTYHLGTGKPDVQLTVEGETPALAQIAGWTKDTEENYTGFKIKTFTPAGDNISTTVHYLVVGKETGYQTSGAVVEVAPGDETSIPEIIPPPNTAPDPEPTPPPEEEPTPDPAPEETPPAEEPAPTLEPTPPTPAPEEEPTPDPAPEETPPAEEPAP